MPQPPLKPGGGESEGGAVMSGCKVGSKTVEGSDFASHKPPQRSEAARKSAIAERLAQMPKSHRRTYLKATRGKGSPRIAIKAFCAECCGWDRQEVRLCTGLACPLWPYRPFVEGQE